MGKVENIKRRKSLFYKNWCGFASRRLEQIYLNIRANFIFLENFETCCMYKNSILWKHHGFLLYKRTGKAHCSLTCTISLKFSWIFPDCWRCLLASEAFRDSNSCFSLLLSLSQRLCASYFLSAVVTSSSDFSSFPWKTHVSVFLSLICVQWFDLPGFFSPWLSLGRTCLSLLGPGCIPVSSGDGVR